jgi:hypothetical protein
MRGHSAGFANAVRYGGTRVQRAYILPANGSAAVEVAMTGFRITADRTAVSCYSGSVELPEGVNRDLLDPYGARIQVVDGFLINGTEELLPVGTMRIDDVEVDEGGAITLTCFSVEKAIEDARFFEPVYVWSDSILSVIVDFARVSHANVSIRTDRDAGVYGVVFDRERWKAIDESLARSLGVEVFVDAAGDLIIRNIPTLEDASVWTVDAGAGGVLVSYRSKVTRDGVYNAVRAENDRVEQGEPAIAAVAADYDDASPTFIDGTFGQVTRFFDSPLLTNVNQAGSAAAAILAQSKGLQRSVTFTSFPHPALEPGDVITVVFPDGSRALHIFDRIEHVSAGYQGGETRTTTTTTLDWAGIDA